MSTILQLPGLIDPHVHLRDPGQTHKEDFYSGTSAALAGGYTAILDMPNNPQPITTLERLEDKISIAQKQIVCDVGFHFGTLGDNYSEFGRVSDQIMGLKIYLNTTTGNFIIDQAKLLEIYEAWPSQKPILLHAEEDVSNTVGKVLNKTKKATHVCHVSGRTELEFVMKSKDAGLPITCGVTPHHLFLSEADAKRLGPFGYMKPYLKSAADQEFLWQHMDYIDVIESDHAPHTIAEKNSESPPFGVPGLDTTLSLMLTAEAQNKITRLQLIDRLHTNPARIFSVPVDDTTYIEVDMQENTLTNETVLTKAGWTPFNGMKVSGRVSKVILRGNLVYDNGKVVAAPGSGKILP